MRDARADKIQIPTTAVAPATVRLRMTKMAETLASKMRPSRVTLLVMGLVPLVWPVDPGRFVHLDNA